MASTMEFFVATVIGWESLIVDTKLSILVALGVLDLSLHEIKLKN